MRIINTKGLNIDYFYNVFRSNAQLLDCSFLYLREI